jgi:endonuclease YncB( thermonuclease family)
MLVVILLVIPLTLIVAALATAPATAATAQRDAAGPPRQDLVGRHFEARVVRIADGDTLEAIPVGESRPVRIRLQGIDAPEIGEVFSREAMALVRSLLFDQQVRADGHGIDRYGRLIARMIRGDADASVHLVRAGLACHAYAYDAALAREESEARAGRVGFWAASAKKPECVTRTAFSASSNNGFPLAPPATPDRHVAGSAPSTPASSQFRGNTSSLVYHASSCPNFMCRNCTRVFRSEAQAKGAGFRPASDCLKR